MAQTDGRSVERAGVHAALMILALALLPIIGARFGNADHAWVLTLVERMADPKAFPGDVLVNVGVGFDATFAFRFLLAKATVAANLVSAVWAATFVATVLVVWVTYAGARGLAGATVLGGLLASAMAVTHGGLVYGGVHALVPEGVRPDAFAVPMALWGLYLVAIRRMLVSVLAFALAMVANPVLGAEIAAVSYTSAIVTGLFVRSRRSVLGNVLRAVACGALVAGCFAVLWLVPQAHFGDAQIAESSLFETLALLNAPELYYTKAGQKLPRLVAAAVLILATLWLLVTRIRRAGRSRKIMTLLVAVVIVTALLGLNLWLVELTESRLGIEAQLLRLTVVTEWVAILMLGWFLGDLLAERGVLAIPLVGVALIANYDAFAFTFAAVLAAAVLMRLLPRVPFVGGALSLGVVLLAVGYGVITTLKLGDPVQIMRGAVAALALGIFAVGWLPGRLATMCGVGLIVTAAGGWMLERHNPVLVQHGLSGALTWDDHTDAEARIARLASETTTADAMFIVPPDFARFRVIAGRSVVVERTALPGREIGIPIWRERMEAVYDLGGDAIGRSRGEMRARYRRGIDFTRVAARYGATHAVIHRATPWDGPVLARSGPYSIVALD